MIKPRIMALALAGLTAAVAAATGPTAPRETAAVSTPPAATSPATAPAGQPPQKNAAGEIVPTFATAPVGKALPTWKEGDVTFALASPPQRSPAQGG